MKISPEEADAVLARSDMLHDAAAVEAALDRMAAEITDKLAGTVPLVLCVMVGGMIPAGKLLPRLQFPLEVDYCHATRYRGEISGGELLWIARPQINVADRTVLIIDDILDEGHTLAQIIDDVRLSGAREVYTAALVNKIHDRRHANMQADFVGLDVADRYVFGAGMDYKGLLRNLPGIYAAPEKESE